MALAHAPSDFLRNEDVSSLNTVDIKALDADPVVVSSAEVGSETSSECRSDEDTLSSNPSEDFEFNVSEEVIVQQATTNDATNEDGYKPEAEVFTAVKILKIIETYGSHYGRVQAPWYGLSGCIPQVTKQIRVKEPIRLLFSGFPFKLPATSQGLGDLPDLGEKMALSHLNGLCSNIAAVYDGGAEVHICSEGLVYNDLLGISDETAWSYGAALRQMAASSKLKHLRFVQLSDILGHEAGTWTKDYTLVHAQCLRRELQYRFPTSDSAKSSTIGCIDVAIRDCVEQIVPQKDSNTQVNLVRSLESRWAAYASALVASTSDYIQLFSRDADAQFLQESDALNISLLPQASETKVLAPWHSAIAIETDGRYRTTSANELRDTKGYELIRDATGVPSHYRAKADMWDWKVDGVEVTFEHLYPTGTMIRPTNPAVAPSIRALPMRKVRLLSQVFSPIVLRGFSETTNEEYFLGKGHELGDILTWTFGQILKVKDSGEVDKNANNVTSNEAMPMHFDGIFKFVDTVDPATGEVKKVLTPPRYQYFTCITTAPKGDGYTLFANSRLFFQHLPSPFSLSRLEKATWSMVNDGFWSAKQTELPLVVRHEETGALCLRWHQPWTKTKFSKYYIEIENDEAAEELVNVINTLLYDYRICLRFEWEQGDLLINDNVSMLHTRTAFVNNCKREMWRIHFD